MMQSAAPAVLLASTCWWHSVPRLALALADAGCSVSAICPPRGHGLRAVPSVQRLFRYSPTDPLQALADAIGAARPDMIVPCDDRVILHLHQLHAAQACGRGAAGGLANDIARLIERSLGNPAGFATARARHPLLSVARAEGLVTPETAELHSPDELDEWLATHELPCVLKVDGSWSGNGVRVVHSRSEAHRAFQRLGDRCPFWLALKRGVINRDPYWLPESLGHVAGSVSVQSYIRGRPANCAVFCWQGRVLAGIAVDVLQTREANTPATIVRLVDRPEMLNAAKVLASRLQMSGFFGLDFMVEAATDRAYVIEMNARPTPLCHLRLGPGRDLVGALISALSGHPLLASCVTQAEIIAYFPDAGRMDDGEIPADAYYDIPVGAPALVAELLRPPFHERGLLARPFNWGTGVVTKWRGELRKRHADRTSPNADLPSQRRAPAMASAKAD